VSSEKFAQKQDFLMQSAGNWLTSRHAGKIDSNLCRMGVRKTAKT
jgi:hypothetical protein